MMQRAAAPLPNGESPNGPKGGSIHIDNLTVAYDRVPAVHHLKGTFAAGSLTAIIGPNGAGKSTLLHAIMGMLRAESGAINIRDANRSDIAFLPQRAEIDQTFPIRVSDLVALGLMARTGLFGSMPKDHTERVIRALRALGLEPLAERPIGKLSVGQFQRVLFARLMVQDARIILLDEPFAALDPPTTADLVRQIASWHREGRTIIAVLHDIEEVRRSFPETLLLVRGATQWGPTDSVLTPQHLFAAGILTRPVTLSTAEVA